MSIALATVLKVVFGERGALSFIPRLARGVQGPTHDIGRWSVTSNCIGLASNPRNDDIPPGDNGDEGGPRENRTLPRDPTVSFFETGDTRRLPDRGEQSRVGPRDLFPHAPL